MRRRNQFISLICDYFNPRTRVGCDLTIIFVSVAVFYFNPRTRVGCDRMRYIFGAVRIISIHAPAWGATGILRKCLSNLSISIHAPAWGATFVLNICHRILDHFNPRTRVGCDASGSRCAADAYDFNPRTRVGCDSEDYGEGGGDQGFQSTHPRGVRPCHYIHA